MEDIYGKTYNKKRLAPGGVTRVEQTRILHNCTTLGGNSGSVVLDLDSGKALGLHFSGSFLATNYAVRADVVKQLLAERSRRADARREARARKPAPTHPATRAAPSSRFGSTAGGTASVTIPLTVTVSLGSASSGRAAAPIASRTAAIASVDDQRRHCRRGRGGRRRLPRPRRLPAGLPRQESSRSSCRRSSAMRTTSSNSRSTADPTTELRYEHYSVVMSRSRRMCFFSAVNIDGNLSKKSARVAMEMGPAHPESAADHEGVLRQIRRSSAAAT